MTIAAAGVSANLSAFSNAASATAAATTPQNTTPASAKTCARILQAAGFLLAYNPDAPFANLQDLVAVPDTSPEAAMTGMLQAANGARAPIWRSSHCLAPLPLAARALGLFRHRHRAESANPKSLGKHGMPDRGRYPTQTAPSAIASFAR